jgi:hypothetical protein
LVGGVVVNVLGHVAHLLEVRQRLVELLKRFLE